jgi:hypothetical protein
MLEFPGLEHRSMLNSTAVKETLTAILRPTLHIRIESLYNFYRRLERTDSVNRRLATLQGWVVRCACGFGWRWWCWWRWRRR